MPKLSLHGRIELALLAAALLGSCDDGSRFSAEERDEIIDIASDGAVDADEFSNLRDRVEAIEQRLGM